MFEDSENSFALASTYELRGQLNRSSMVSFSSVLRSLRVHILKQLFFSISVNSGRIFTWPLCQYNILPPLLNMKNFSLQHLPTENDCSHQTSRDLCSHLMILPPIEIFYFFIFGDGILTLFFHRRIKRAFKKLLSQFQLVNYQTTCNKNLKYVLTPQLTCLLFRIPN